MSEYISKRQEYIIWLNICVFVLTIGLIICLDDIAISRVVEADELFAILMKHFSVYAQRDKR